MADRSLRELLVENGAKADACLARMEDFCERLATHDVRLGSVERELIGEAGDPDKTSVRRGMAEIRVTLEEHGKALAGITRAREARTKWMRGVAGTVAAAGIISGLAWIRALFTGEAPKPPTP